jgi:hypothetical protein
MKKTLGITGFITISLFVIQSVVSNKTTTVVFENKSNLQVDSVIFTINKYKGKKILNIGPGGRGIRKISADSIDTNKHDVMVMASIFGNGKFVKDGFYYTDLSGSLHESYTLTLRPDLTVSLK